MLPLDRQNEWRDQLRRERPGWLPASERFARLVKSHLPASAPILDLGCGRGGIVEQLDIALARVIGLDPDERSLHEHRLPALPRAVAPSHALPLPAACIGLALASWVLEHLSSPADDLSELARVLQPGGALVFITPNRSHPLITINRGLSRLDRLQRRLVTTVYGRAAVDTFPAYYRANTPDELRRLATGCGLILDQLEAVADPSYYAALPLAYPALRWLDGRLPDTRAIHLVGLLRKPGSPTASRPAREPT